MSKPSYDAIIVGARCAGSPTALLLAALGSGLDNGDKDQEGDQIPIGLGQDCSRVGHLAVCQGDREVKGHGRGLADLQIELLDGGPGEIVSNVLVTASLASANTARNSGCALARVTALEAAASSFTTWDSPFMAVRAAWIAAH